MDPQVVTRTCSWISKDVNVLENSNEQKCFSQVGGEVWTREPWHWRLMLHNYAAAPSVSAMWDHLNYLYAMCGMILSYPGKHSLA